MTFCPSSPPNGSWWQASWWDCTLPVFPQWVPELCWSNRPAGWLGTLLQFSSQVDPMNDFRNVLVWCCSLILQSSLSRFSWRSYSQSQPVRSRLNSKNSSCSFICAGFVIGREGSTLTIRRWTVPSPLATPTHRPSDFAQYPLSNKRTGIQEPTHRAYEDYESMSLPCVPPLGKSSRSKYLSLSNNPWLLGPVIWIAVSQISRRN